MKKLLFLGLIMVFAYSNIKAQLKMFSNGNVMIGSTNTPTNVLQVLGLINFDDAKSSTFVGYSAGSANSGTLNSFFGYNAGQNNQGANASSAFGYQALYANTSGNNNNAFGGRALYNNISGSYNLGLGDNALLSNTTGSGNIAAGQGALSYSNATNNTAIGHNALYTNTSGNYNTAIGCQTLYYNSTGNDNTALGKSSGYGSTGINFNQCTFIGSSSYPTVARTNVTMLGYGIANGQCTGDNQVCLGNTAIVSPGLRSQQTGITAYSDARFKTNIKEEVAGLSFILKLKPVTYNIRPMELHKIWGTPDSMVNNLDFSEAEKETRIGFVAQDVEKAAKDCGFNFPGLDIPKNEKEVYTMRYVDFIMPIVKSIQELNEKNILQKSVTDSLKTLLSEIKSIPDLRETIKLQDETIEKLQQQIDNCCTSGSIQSKSTVPTQKTLNFDNSDSSESKAKLYQNAPNPFTSSTQIKCFIPQTNNEVKLCVYSMTGELVKCFNILSKGYSSVNIQANELNAGIYAYVLIADGQASDTKQMILTK